MNTERESGAQLPNGHGSLVALALLALVVGATTGLICAGFRTALEHADRFRDFLIGWAHGHPIPGFVLVVVACSLATFLAAWLVFRLAPHAVGSGIPHVEVVLRGQVAPAPYGLGAVKFAGVNDGLVDLGQREVVDSRGAKVIATFGIVGVQILDMFDHHRVHDQVI